MYKRNQFFNKVFSLSLLVSPFAIQANIDSGIFSDQAQRNQNIGKSNYTPEDNKQY